MGTLRTAIIVTTGGVSVRPGNAARHTMTIAAVTVVVAVRVSTGGHPHLALAASHSAACSNAPTSTALTAAPP